MREFDKSNRIDYNGINIGRRDIIERLSYENAYLALDFGKQVKSPESTGVTMALFYIYIYEKMDNKSFKLISEQEAEDFVYFISNELGVKDVSTPVRKVYNFYDYLCMKEYITNNPFIHLKKIYGDTIRKGRTTHLLTKEQIEKIINSNIHDYLKLYVLFSISTGATGNQVRKLRWEHFEDGKRVIRINDAILYINVEVAKMLEKEQQYRIENKMNDSGYVFRSYDIHYFGENAPISYSTLTKWDNIIGNEIGIPNLRHLDFRHTTIKNMMEAGASMGLVGFMIGDKTLHTTKRCNYFATENNNEILQEYKDMCDV